jgi:hypothetical protein
MWLREHPSQHLVVDAVVDHREAAFPVQVELLRMAFIGFPLDRRSAKLYRCHPR